MSRLVRWFFFTALAVPRSFIRAWLGIPPVELVLSRHDDALAKIIPQLNDNTRCMRAYEKNVPGIRKIRDAMLEKDRATARRKLALAVPSEDGDGFVPAVEEKTPA